MEIRLPECSIRPWRAEDVDSLTRHANNYNVWRNLRDLFPHPYLRSDAVDWIAYAAEECSATNFAIVVDGEAAGGVGLIAKTDVHRKTAEIGYWLGEAVWGRGVATAAVRAISEYAFANFDFCRLEAGVFEWNAASMRVLEKVGYVREATLEKACFKDGRLIDLVLYAKVRRG